MFIDGCLLFTVLEKPDTTLGLDVHNSVCHRLIISFNPSCYKWSHIGLPVCSQSQARKDLRPRLAGALGFSDSTSSGLARENCRGKWAIRRVREKPTGQEEKHLTPDFERDSLLF